MADRSMQSWKGIIENVLLKINKFIFHVDFIILDTIEDDKVLIILGSPMLATAHAMIDVFDKKISLEVGSARLNDDSSGMFCNPNSNSSISLDDFVKMDDV
nr:putative reverse transcriptase domain-containing protein [Tanacetum cinerariifolium]